MHKSKKNKTSISPKKLPEKIIAVLITYVKTQLLLTAIITVTSWVFLSLLNVRYALLLAIFTGAVSIAPVAGITIAAVTVAIVAIFDGIRFLPNLPTIVEGLVILLLYGVLNIGMDYFLSPYLTGKIIKINPLLLLLAIIIGTAVFGILGTLLTVPLILVVKTIIDHYNELVRSNKMVT